MLEQLTDNDKVEHIANQLMEVVPRADLNDEYMISLKEFFTMTVPLNTGKRLSEIAK
jgi:hypothetical protein